MTQHRDLNTGDQLPASWLDALQEFIGPLSTPNLATVIVGGTQIRIPAGTGNDQVGLGISGRWRYISAPVTTAAISGAAGTYPLFATASDNAFSNAPVLDTDTTVYTFGLEVRTDGSQPTAALSRQIGTVVWTGAAVSGIDLSLVPDHAFNHRVGGSDPVSPALIGAATAASPAFTGTATATTDLVARLGLSSQVTIGGNINSGIASIAFGSANDASIQRSAAGVLMTPGAFNVGGGFTVTGLISNPGASATTVVEQALVTGDTVARFSYRADGLHAWGPGGATATDVTLGRSAVGTLAITGALAVSGALSAASPVFSGSGSIAGEFVARTGQAGQVTIGNTAGGAGVLFGSASDTNLYRAAAGTLRTDGQLTVGGAAIAGATLSAIGASSFFGTGGAATDTGFVTFPRGRLGYDGTYIRWDDNGGSKHLRVYSGAADNLVADFYTGLVSFSPTVQMLGSLTFGTAQDTNLYRSAAGQLKTDGSLAVQTRIDAALVAGTTGVGNTAAIAALTAGDTQSRWAALGSGTLYWGSGSAPSDSTLYRTGVSALRTNSAFTIDGLLTASSNAVFSGYVALPTGQVFTGTGSAAAPSLSFYTDNATGFYWDNGLGPSTIYITSQGTVAGYINSANWVMRVTTNVQVKNSANTAYAPILASAFTVNSDERLKKNIEIVGDPVALVRAMPDLVRYDWKSDDQQEISGRTLGLIAQDVQGVLPEAVSASSNGSEDDDDTEYLGIDYAVVGTLAFGAVKALLADLDDALARITALETA